MGSTDLQFSALSIIAKKGQVAKLRTIIPKELHERFDGATKLKSSVEHSIGQCPEGMTWKVETSGSCITIKVSWASRKSLGQVHQLDTRLRSGQEGMRSVPIFAPGPVSSAARAALVGAIAGNNDWYEPLSKVK
ncbi:MAG TPA: hypothetical protein VFZ48_02535 [Candidatus Saccharimonadales bacterium]